MQGVGDRRRTLLQGSGWLLAGVARRAPMTPWPPCTNILKPLTPHWPPQGDTRLRALRFLGTLMQREPAQKAAFFKDLETMLGSLDGRVLRTLVRGGAGFGWTAEGCWRLLPNGVSQ